MLQKREKDNRREERRMGADAGRVSFVSSARV